MQWTIWDDIEEEAKMSLVTSTLRAYENPDAWSRELADHRWPGYQYGDRLVYWGLISFKDDHSRDQVMRDFIAERMTNSGRNWSRFGMHT